MNPSQGACKPLVGTEQWLKKNCCSQRILNTRGGREEGNLIDGKEQGARLPRRGVYKQRTRNNKHSTNLTEYNYKSPFPAPSRTPPNSRHSPFESAKKSSSDTTFARSN